MPGDLRSVMRRAHRHDDDPLPEVSPAEVMGLRRLKQRLLRAELFRAELTLNREGTFEVAGIEPFRPLGA